MKNSTIVKIHLHSQRKANKTLGGDDQLGKHLFGTVGLARVAENACLHRIHRWPGGGGVEEIGW